MAIDSMSPDDITATLKSNKTNYVDIEFPPLYEILYDPVTIKEYPFKNAVHFKRPTDWLTGDINVFLDGIEPHDIRGGELADSFLLSAL